MKSSCVLYSRLVDAMTSCSVQLLATCVELNRTVVSPAVGLLDGGEEPKVSVWFICQSLEWSVRCRSMMVGGDKVALGCV